MEQPIYFMYDYQSNQAADNPPVADTTGFTASAQANMGGSVKQLSISGLVRAQNNQNILVVSPAIDEDEAATAGTLQLWSAGGGS